MANAEISIVGPSEAALIASLYNNVFTPKREAAFFHRRYDGRENVLNLVAEIDGQPIGFSCGFELKPNTWFNWLVGVLPDFRRAGIASQLLEAEQSWAVERGYAFMRMECHNQHRPVMHVAISQDFDVIGLRWDNDRHANLVIFEKELGKTG